VRYRLLCVDRIRERPIATLVDDFARRLGRYVPIEITEVPRSGVADAAQAVLHEGEALLARIGPGERVWLLERTGAQLGSEALAARLESLSHEGISRLTLVVAGTFGASTALIERADFLWSLSPLTLLHEWARALAVEQLYRAAKIARNEPYHH
jgi:23S rRNA (pseudouridine1915-N3)-methyltransferase